MCIKVITIVPAIAVPHEIFTSRVSENSERLVRELCEGKLHAWFDEGELEKQGYLFSNSVIYAKRLNQVIHKAVLPAGEEAYARGYYSKGGKTR